MLVAESFLATIGAAINAAPIAGINLALNVLDFHIGSMPQDSDKDAAATDHHIERRL